MNSRQPRRPWPRGIACAVLSLALSASMTPARAEAPSFSGPSMARPSAPTMFSGRGFAANAAVTVMVQAPSGAAAGFGAVTQADGSFSYTLVPDQAGAYTLTVTNSAGKALTKAVVAVVP